jgi:hypothetical protein
LLGGLVALRDGRHQRFDEQALSRCHLGDARQRLRDGVVGQRRVAGHLARQLQRLGQTFACADQVVAQARGLAFGSVEDAAGEHHVGHARHAHQPRNAR